MNALIRMVVASFTVGLLSLCVLSLHLAYSPNDSLEDRRAEELNALEGAIARHEQAQRQAVQEWIDRRRTLAESLQRLQELDRQWEKQWPPHRIIVQEMPPLSKEERHYHTIRNSLEGMLQAQPEALTAVLRRLDRDYQQLQARSQQDTPAAAERETWSPGATPGR